MKPNALRVMLAVAMLMPVSALAGSDDEGGPGRGVARLSVINGDVSLRRGDSGDVIAAAINAPLVSDDRVYTGGASRAEVQFDHANMVRISGDTELRMSQLEYKRYTLQLPRGLVTFRVLRDGDPADVEIDTPSVSVRPVKRGTYRIMVSDDGATEVTVRSGETEIFTPRGSERLTAGRTMMVRGNPSDPEFQIVAEVGRDNWDRWNEDRDRELEGTQVYQYVSRDIYGAEDLAGQGQWISDPAYGWVWAPDVAAGWAPYRYGRWAWVDWYGWTWVSYDPWGWAPYHYGRWYYRPAFGWCWYPGAMHIRHYWRPALVAFFGFGSGGVGLGWGHVGWIPLAPREPFYPWYGRGYYGAYRNGTYIDNSVRIVNNVNVTNVYRNARVANAVTAVDAGGFGRGRTSEFIRVTNDQIGRASLARGVVPVAPVRESLRLADREASRTVRASDDRAKFFSTRQQTAREERVPFEQQRVALEQASRRAFGGDARASEPARTGEVRSNAPAARQTETPAARSAEAHTDGWRRVATPSRSDVPSTAEPRTEVRTEGWRRSGTTAQPGAAVDRTIQPRTAEPRTAEPSRDNTWRRFGDPGTSRMAEPRVPAPSAGRTDIPAPARVEQRTEPRSEPRTEPRTERQDNNSWRRDWGSSSRAEAPARNFAAPVERPAESSGRSEALRLNTPIVRERIQAAPRVESPRMESPRMESPRAVTPHVEAPRVQAPRMEAPRSSGGAAPAARSGGGSHDSGGQSRGGGNHGR